MNKITIAVVGAGTVGGGVIDVLTKEHAKLKREGVDIVLKTICATKKPKASDVVIPSSTTFTTDIKKIYEDPEIDVVVELISNVKVGGEIILQSLRSGKSVVSANKAALAEVYPEISKILKENLNLYVGIEAAVAGGIPVIAPLIEHMCSDSISRISGILNGTTNFIITKMEKEGLAYQDVLKEAQALGYAEADPKADVDGYDARSKLSLLMQLAYGIHPNKDISTTGISDIADIDFEYARMLNATIRCLGVGAREGNKVSGFVSPCIVSNTSNFAAITGATNAVSIDSKYLRNTFLVGQGAGRYPTAVSVISDVVRIAKGSCYSIAPRDNKVPTFVQDYQGQFYIRLYIQDGLGIVEKVGNICKKHKVSIDAILQLPVGTKDILPFVITTDTTMLSKVKKIVDELEKLSFVKGRPFMMPIIKAG
jgi:homoserine dehydrogenase